MSWAWTPKRRSRSAPDLRRRRRILLVCLGAAAIAAGCASQSAVEGLCVERDAISECGSVTGVVLATEGTGPAAVERFTLRTPDGQVYDFAIDRLDVSRGGKPSAHLREHQVDGHPIVVEYKVESGRHVALRYTDAE